ncbi:MAG: hypothetical protein KKH61_21565 [Gammaproteobacteria bacterium]|nr:hypothetical protein [Gammaproteobacteria bacterium]
MGILAEEGRGNIARVASLTGFTASYISMIASGKKKVAVWQTAKKLSDATGAHPEVFLEGTVEQIKLAILGLKKEE